jgi:hypothetical protein
MIDFKPARRESLGYYEQQEQLSKVALIALTFLSGCLLGATIAMAVL